MVENKHKYWDDGPFTPKYSDVESEEFWKAVNGLPEAEQQELYFAGVLLQNMEGDILKNLNRCLREAKEKK